jgi:hypothetical protein
MTIAAHRSQAGKNYAMTVLVQPVVADFVGELSSVATVRIPPLSSPSLAVEVRVFYPFRSSWISLLLTLLLSWIASTDSRAMVYWYSPLI